MDQTPEQIERHIAQTKNSLSENIGELEDKIRDALDWRAQFKERPGTMLAAAFGGGALLAGLLPSGHSSSARTDTRWNEPVERETQNLSRPRNNDNVQSSETLNALKGALIAVATNKLSGMIEEFIPGFKREFDAQSGKIGYPSSSTNPEPVSWQRTGGGSL